MIGLWSGYRDGVGIIPYQFTLPEWSCPSLTFSLGTVSFKSASQNSTARFTLGDTDINTLVCSQNLQSVETNMTLDYPSMAIVKNPAPQPDEGTVKWLENSEDSTGGTSFQFVLNNMFISLNNPNGSMSGPWVSSDYADRFTQALVYVAQKEHGILLENLAGNSNSETYLNVLQSCTEGTWLRPYPTTCEWV